jgi:uncharacterized protein YjbI with pentapeptide repeats
MRWPAWLGVGERRWKRSPDEEVQPGKTLWDFLQLLIVPAMLAALALLYNASQESRDRKRDENARMDATLDAYFAQMGSLMLHNHLLTAPRGSEVRYVARTATLTAVRRLDGRRKAEVISFLDESQLSQRPDEYGVPAVWPYDAELRGAELAGANIGPIWGPRVLDLSSTDLRDARFDNAQLYRVNFDYADLRGASFRNAIIAGASFRESNLTNAVFDEATIVPSRMPTNYGDVIPTQFIDSCLTNTSFVRVRFRSEGGEFPPGDGAIFEYVVGHDTDFSHAHLQHASMMNTRLTNVRLDGTEGQPKGWGPNGPRKVDRSSRRGHEHTVCH